MDSKVYTFPPLKSEGVPVIEVKFLEQRANARPIAVRVEKDSVVEQANRPPSAGKLRRSHRKIKGWSSIRTEIIIRDDFACQDCGATGVVRADALKGETPLSVHHIDTDRTHNQPDNLVTLCHSCHTKRHTVRK